MIHITEKDKQYNPEFKFKKLTVRLTQEEYEKVVSDMEKIHCLSFSKYMRMLLLHKKIRKTNK